MRQPPDELDIRRPKTTRHDRREAPSPWRRALPGIGLIAVLAATVAALYGSGHIASASAADVGAAVKQENHQGQAGVAAQKAQKQQTGCTLTVPANPLSAQGLATPYLLSGSIGSVACHETDTGDAAFVQAAVIDPAKATISIYNPLVIDRGARPAAPPVTPTLPANAVVGIWFGSNANGLTLKSDQPGTLANANCVNGLGQSIFGQMAFCNAATFFQTANQLISSGKLTPPALGTGLDKLTCPTVRDFSVVDQDQSDNVTTAYRIAQDGKLAQNTSSNAAKFAHSVLLTNGSDNGLLSIRLDGALGCSAWRAPDLADPGQMVTALPLDELQAARYQGAPIALVPSADPMVVDNGQASLAKQNAYRLGVDQPAETSAATAKADQLAYCRNVMSIAPGRLQEDRVWTSGASSPDPATASNLFTFLAARLSTTLGPNGLNCTGLLGQPNPVHLMTGDRIVVGATFGGDASQVSAPATSGAAPTNAPTTTTTPATTSTAAPSATKGGATKTVNTVKPTTPVTTVAAPRTATPTSAPPSTPTNSPTVTPTTSPTSTPTNSPTVTPTVTPTSTPATTPGATPSPTSAPNATATTTPTSTPTTGAGSGAIGG